MPSAGCLHGGTSGRPTQAPTPHGAPWGLVPHFPPKGPWESSQKRPPDGRQRPTAQLPWAQAERQPRDAPHVQGQKGAPRGLERQEPGPLSLGSGAAQGHTCTPHPDLGPCPRSSMPPGSHFQPQGGGVWGLEAPRAPPTLARQGRLENSARASRGAWHSAPKRTVQTNPQPVVLKANGDREPRRGRAPAPTGCLTLWVQPRGSQLPGNLQRAGLQHQGLLTWSPVPPPRQGPRGEDGRWATR